MKKMTTAEEHMMFGEESKKEEPAKEVFVMCMKGDEKVKARFVDYVKMGFGFYVGYNIARALKRAIIITNITK